MSPSRGGGVRRWANRLLLVILWPAALASSCARGESPESADSTSAEAITDTPPIANGRRASSDSVVDLSRFFEGSEPIDATFLLVRASTGSRTVYRPERASQRFRPASTFKIPNSLIALETGVASGPEFFLPYDSVATPTTRRVWARDQTLETAFRNSVYWYYQELARRTGEPRMRDWLGRLEYGNQSIGGGIDRFWLSGDLRISPAEQVRFIERLVKGGLPVSARSRAIVIDFMRQRDTTTYRLFGKTGTSEVTPTRENGWLVGWVETTDDTLYYALNMEGESVWEDWPPDRRVGLVERILTQLQVIPST